MINFPSVDGAISLEDADVTLAMASTVDFSDVAIAAEAVAVAVEDYYDLSMEMANTNMQLLNAVAMNDNDQVLAAVSQEEVEEFGISLEAEDGEETKALVPVKDNAKKAQDGKFKKFLKDAKDRLLEILKKIGDFFAKLGSAIVNAFKTEKKLWDDLEAKAKEKGGKGNPTVKKAVSVRAMNELTESYVKVWKAIGTLRTGEGLTDDQAKDYISGAQGMKLKDHKVVVTGEYKVDEVLTNLSGIKFESVAIAKSGTQKLMSKVKSMAKKEDYDATEPAVLKGRQMGLWYGNAIGSVFSVIKQCRTALANDSAPDPQIVKKGSYFYNEFKRKVG